MIAPSHRDVLKSARELEAAATFFSRLNRRGAGNKDMRTFVETFRTRLGEGGAVYDDEAVWRLLQRIQILVFDFTAEGSASAECPNPGLDADGRHDGLAISSRNFFLHGAS